MATRNCSSRLNALAARRAARSCRSPYALDRRDWPNVKAVLCGSGMGGMQTNEVVDNAVRLTGLASPRVLYLGTPTYDLPAPAAAQTRLFKAQGCPVSALDLTDGIAAPDHAAAAIAGADIIVVSGGNPLFALARWDGLGLAGALTAAIRAGTVVCGGSCGLICWFDGGHSDSGDPASFKAPMLAGVQTQESAGGADDGPEVEGADSWDYVRAPCLGVLPGLVCPHHDKVQTNGVLRATDFDQMMCRHPGERGLAVDHWAVLVLEAGKYSVVPVEGKPGSVGPDGQFVDPLGDQSGSPGVWAKRVEEGQLVSELVASTGSLNDLLQPASSISQDPNIFPVMKANPAFPDPEQRQYNYIYEF